MVLAGDDSRHQVFCETRARPIRLPSTATLFTKRTDNGSTLADPSRSSSSILWVPSHRHLKKTSVYWCCQTTVQSGNIQSVFCYLSLPKRIRDYQRTQLESRLIAEPLRCAENHNTPHPSSDQHLVERGNRELRNMLRSMLLGRDKDWDLLADN